MGRGPVLAFGVWMLRVSIGPGGWDGKSVHIGRMDRMAVEYAGGLGAGMRRRGLWDDLPLPGLAMSPVDGAHEGIRGKRVLCDGTDG